jgi:hypothetical protein
MSDFSVHDRGLPHYGIADVVFPLAEAQAAYDAVGTLISSMSASVQARNAAADRALANWTGPHADNFRECRTKWLDGRLIYAELLALRTRLLNALKTYQGLQRQVIIDRQHAHDAALNSLPRRVR